MTPVNEVAERSKNFFAQAFENQKEAANKVSSLREAVRRVFNEHDPRRPTFTTYSYDALYNMILFAGLAGFKTKDDIRMFWICNPDKFKAFFPELDTIPSTATINRALRLIDESVMEDEMNYVLTNQYDLVRKADGSYFTVELSKRDVIGCDGQAMRATAKRKFGGGRETGFQITSLVSYNTGITLGQLIHNIKNQEREDIIEIAKEANIANAILTWDAINTVAPVVDMAVNKGADVFVCVKSNQSKLYYDCKTAVDAYREGNPLYRQEGRFATGQAMHTSGGKIYNKSIVVLVADDCMVKDIRPKWKNINTICCITTECYDPVTGKTTVSDRYFISSIPLNLEKYPNIANDFIEISLKRWCVEVNHYYLDTFFNQDRATYEYEDAAYTSTIMSKVVTSAFNFAKNAYNAEELRYKGACTTPNLKMACSNLDFSMLLMESFFSNKPELLVKSELSVRFKFMKQDVLESPKQSSAPQKSETPSVFKLEDFLKSRKVKKAG